MAMEPDCLEPLNLVIKKDTNGSRSDIVEKNTGTAEEKIEEETAKPKLQDNMTIMQESVKSDDTAMPSADQKFLTALYMSSILQMSNASALRNVTPAPFSGQQNFMQLLAMVEARHRMWQQLSWSVPPNFLRNPIGLPQPYYDGPVANLTEQLCNSPNSMLTYPLPSAKHEQANPEVKQSYFKRYLTTSTLLSSILNFYSETDSPSLLFQVYDRTKKLFVVTCGQHKESRHRATK